MQTGILSQQLNKGFQVNQMGQTVQTSTNEILSRSSLFAIPLNHLYFKK